MNVLVCSYPNVYQNKSGGVQVRIRNYMENIVQFCDVKQFDMWSDNINDADIIHFFGARPDNFGAINRAKSLGKKIVLSPIIAQSNASHIIYNLALSKIFHIRTVYTLIKMELDMADCILAQTLKEKYFIEKYYRIDGEKITVIPNGIGMKFNESSRDVILQKYGISDKYVLQVGRFDENKNQLSVIRALKGTGIPVLFIGGEDPNCKEYYYTCQDEADDNMHFLGWIEAGNEIMQSAYMNAHTVILPSKKEIFGNALLEGGAAGARLISTKTLPVDEIGIGRYCKKIDPTDIADIRNAVCESMREDKDTNQAEWIRSNFSWHSIARRHFEIYQKVLEK